MLWLQCVGYGTCVWFQHFESNIFFCHSQSEIIHSDLCCRISPENHVFKIPLPNPAGSPVPWSQGWNRTELHGFIDWIFMLPIQEETNSMPLLIQQPHFKDNDLWYFWETTSQTFEKHVWCFDLLNLLPQSTQPRPNILRPHLVMLL